MLPGFSWALVFPVPPLAYKYPLPHRGKLLGCVFEDVMYTERETIELEDKTDANKCTQECLGYNPFILDKPACVSYCCKEGFEFQFYF